MFSALHKFLYYIFAFIIATFLIFLGVIAMMLPWSTSIRTDLVTFILENSIAISLIGFGFFILGVAWWVNLWQSSKRSYYQVRVGNKKILIDESILQHYVDAYWQQLLPGKEVPNQLIIRNNQIKIVADLPYKPVEERKAFLETVQQELQDLLTNVLGYSQEFVLAVSFAKYKN